MELLPAVILAIPVLAALACAAVPRARPGLAHAGAALAMGVATLLAVILAVEVVGGGVPVQGPHVTWLDLGTFTFGLGTLVDPMGAIMTVIVCLLATLVLVFNAWYLHDDPSAARFPWQLCGFAAAMLGVVLADNLLLAFVCWELVGLGSYLLIGFWFAKPAAAEDAEYQARKGACARGVNERELSPSHAQQKAFVMNRVGDAGFLIGIGAALVAAVTAGLRDPLAWDGLARLAQSGEVDPTLLTIAALGIFCGAVSKSAQFPLHPWLPDAMQGPTTASSIIHAATMVAAGVFLVARAYPLFPPVALDVVGWVGGLTCLMAACIACVQWDLKAVLAYSTISQLGLMFVGLGAGAAAHGDLAGIAHLFSHALFKCLLFLGAGAVIHACGGHQDLARLGGLRRRMPITAWTSLFAVLAIIGTPFFSAAWSKDAIFAAAIAHAQAVGGLAIGPLVFALLGSLLTAIYMLRWWLRIFAGEARDPAVTGHAHDPARSASAVLLVLAPFALGLPWTFDGWLDHALGGARAEEHGPALEAAHHNATLLASILCGVGASIAWFVFGWGARDGRDLGGALARRLRPLHVACAELFGIDRLAHALVTRGLGRGLARLSARFDLGSASRLESLETGARGSASIDGLIDGLGRALLRVGKGGSLLHAGRLGAYVAFATIAGLLVLLAVLLR
ncbi:MAG: NADH-quinone oxidoreductase subunit L [Planctomycetes bacterium]|nr:NADH-quinone oxidoreductase subunit L [Planctomycetota bacterium]